MQTKNPIGNNSVYRAQKIKHTEDYAFLSSLRLENDKQLCAETTAPIKGGQLVYIHLFKSALCRGAAPPRVHRHAYTY